jgi:hypothetical protein
MRLIASGTWTYNTNTIRQANNSSANRLEVVVGVNEVPMDARVSISIADSGGSGAASIGIGLDSTTVYATGLINGTASMGVANKYYPLTAALKTYVGVGYHAVNWLEVANGGGTVTWYADATNNAASGIQGEIDA